VPVFNYAKKEVNLKIVYYGPGLSGKTTNLQAIHDGIKPEFKGKLVSLATQTDRTLFFDFMPLELGSLGGFRVRLHLYTVPGQVHYNATRKLVLKGVDGVVFVADSQRAMTDANLESFMNLEKNLQSYGKVLKDTPHIIQANKRDLEDIVPVDEIGSLVNRYGANVTEAVASRGDGVLETLTEIVRIVVKSLKDTFALHRGEVFERKKAEPSSEALPGEEMQPVSDQTPVPEPVTERQGPEEVASQPESAGVAVEKGAEELSSDEEETTVSETEAARHTLEMGEPIHITVPVEGIGKVELSISVRARLLSEGDEKILEADLQGTEIDTSDQIKPLETPVIERVPEPAPPEQGVQDVSLESKVEVGKKFSGEKELPPLGELSEEPLGAPLDGQEDGSREILEPSASGEEKDILEADDETVSPVHDAASTEPSQEYDPTTQPIDLFEEEKPGPQEPEPKKKGVLGLFKKK